MRISMWCVWVTLVFMQVAPPALGADQTIAGKLTVTDKIGVGVPPTNYEVQAEKSVPGGNVTVWAKNLDNTNPNSHARNYLQVRPNGGDAKSVFAVEGSTVWAFGLDNSDGDKFKISRNTNLGVNDRFILTPEGNITVPGEMKVGVLEVTGADLSERFDIDESKGVPKPGMIVCIDPENPGGLVVSERRYDKTVLGVVSGAGGIRPGMLLGQEGTLANGEHPIALTGRVYCWADASFGPIQPGDMLTTSDTPGHSMKVSDHGEAYGAVIGKAMTRLDEGRGLVLIVVSLQ